jgi:lipopolysaccharide transport system ATP-binding protein
MEQAIQVIGISKRYQVGLPQSRSLRETLVRTTGNLLRARTPTQENEFWALDDVSFELKKGEVLGIIGRNGSGKSTLLKILSRVTRPTRGRALIHGRVAALLEVGTGFHAELTGRENIYMNGTILGMSRNQIRRRLDEIIEFSGVEKFIDTPVKHYSSGMTVRLAFAVAAHLEPEILIVDEVLAVGDVEFQKKCIGKMQDVASAEGRTVLFVSHHLPSVKRLCKRGLVLRNGKKVYEGGSDDAVNFYLNQGGNRQSLLEALKAEKNKSQPVELLDLKVCGSDGAENEHFSSDESIDVEVTYRVKETIEDLLVKIVLSDSDGNPILATVDLDYPGRTTLKRKEPGIYTSRCHIPADLFGNQRFYVDLVIAKRETTPYMVNLKAVASFETVLMCSKEKNFGDTHGISLRPGFQWTIEKEEGNGR